MKKPDKVIFLENGNTFVADESGEQIPELQVSWLKLYKEFLQKNNVDPSEVKFILPGKQTEKLLG